MIYCNTCPITVRENTVKPTASLAAQFDFPYVSPIPDTIIFLTDCKSNPAKILSKTDKKVEKVACSCFGRENVNTRR